MQAHSRKVSSVSSPTAHTERVPCCCMCPALIGGANCKLTLAPGSTRAAPGLLFDSHLNPQTLMANSIRLFTAAESDDFPASHCSLHLTSILSSHRLCLSHTLVFSSVSLHGHPRSSHTYPADCVETSVDTHIQVILTYGEGLHLRGWPARLSPRRDWSCPNMYTQI
ncbi:hypothetical protein L211DRAFT_475287 [Terfezia boudieri ATCC MYA-4762]|uniref:Uncharacterized protein n=1 Tax=Terfezia boudieri ATCC MYA-4762 TaxID=1051890 RepID=A0A3N4M255_9PEZI|nr:hypothetical protein L211DRAFT_475287 [Terfezia boudieri ATCC MYA-4762]